MNQCRHLSINPLHSAFIYLHVTGSCGIFFGTINSAFFFDISSYDISSISLEAATGGVL